MGGSGSHYSCHGDGDCRKKIQDGTIPCYAKHKSDCEKSIVCVATDGEYTGQCGYECNSDHDCQKLKKDWKCNSRHLCYTSDKSHFSNLDKEHFNGSSSSFPWCWLLIIIIIIAIIYLWYRNKKA
jgi:hypothetical protein